MTIVILAKALLPGLPPPIWQPIDLNLYAVILSMGLELTIEIDRSQTGGTFTNHDLISGIVKLTSTSSAALAYIQVKLEGISTSQMTIPYYKNKNEVRQVSVLDVHRLLYDTLIVFPPENVRNVSKAKDFTITPGTYTYPFQFRIPLKTNCAKNESGPTYTSSNPLGAFSLDALKRDLNDIGLINHQDPGSRHYSSQLPPTLPSKNHSAEIKYFVKATCKRSSLFKMSSRSHDFFTFLPLDLMDVFAPVGLHEQEYKEVFFRKDVVFKNRIPEIVGVKMEKEAVTPRPQIYERKKSYFSSFFSPPSPPIPPEKPRRTSSGRSIDVQNTDVPFAFEIRFQHPARLSPTEPPQFKLFLVSNTNPLNYTLAQYGKPEESNGLGIVYLQRLVFELLVVTEISVLAYNGRTTDVHRSRLENKIPICNNTFQDLTLDLMYSKRQKSTSASSNGHLNLNCYELEIPRKYYENFKLPRDLAPTFKTCNLERIYSLAVTAGVSSERVAGLSSREMEKHTKYLDLACYNIIVLSGLKLTQALHSNASNPSFGTSVDSNKDNGRLGELRPPMAQRPSEKGRQSTGSYEDSTLPLPTYEDVVRESSYQDDSEHIRARHRYQK